jgi:hypothetical protein
MVTKHDCLSREYFRDLGVILDTKQSRQPEFDLSRVTVWQYCATKCEIEEFHIYPIGITPPEYIKHEVRY